MEYSYTVCNKLNRDPFKIDKSNILRRAARDWGGYCLFTKKLLNSVSPERATLVQCREEIIIIIKMDPSLWNIGSAS